MRKIKTEIAKLQLEVREQANLTPEFNLGGGKLLMTPAIDEDYWQFRVKVGHGQAIVAFPKFGTIGIGFAKETDWNTNLPYSCSPEKIWNHIKHNKGSKAIRDADCLKAIEMVCDAARNETKSVSKNS